jgi:putative Mg2+ transporter-C (MgtC) family protein
LNADDFEMLARLLAALGAGALIGYERSFHGRPAGFRTHAHWMRQATGLVQIDPTRMAQGIMTGIGFLGAGVIIKEGLSVRGLTTAASIWITAAIGILAGVGFYFPLVISVLLTLGVLSFFRWIEARMPSHAYYHFAVRFARGPGMTERQLRELVESHGFSIANFSYRMEGPDRVRRHNMVIRSADRSGAGRLAVALEGMDAVLEFRITPTSD